MPWGAYWGTCADRFGVRWMFNCARRRRSTGVDGGEDDLMPTGLEPTFRHTRRPRRGLAAGQGDPPGRRHDVIGMGEVAGLLARSPVPLALRQVGPRDGHPRHGHYSPHVIFVISGEMWCGDRHCPAGTHVELPLVRPSAPSSPARGHRAARGHDGRPPVVGRPPRAVQAPCGPGAEALPDPDIDLPDWLVDLRSRWVVDGG